MKLSDLDYPYPENLIAQTPQRPCRVMQVLKESEVSPQEINMQQLLSLFNPGDTLVINDTQVLKRRVFSHEGLEFLFLKQKTDREWQVLFPAKKFSLGEQFQLPGGVTVELLKKGRPQEVTVSGELSEDYFLQHGEVPLPPYIQKARGERHTQDRDEGWYQTSWAHKPGSFAAPTASLHFSNEDLDFLKFKGVAVVSLTLHVGLGTFLPVTVDNLSDHAMHSEWVEIPVGTWQSVQETKALGGKVWALGTTVTRALESVPRNKFSQNPEGFFGVTDLLIQEGFEFRVIDHLLTNFHQPKSTLLALVAAFAGLQRMHEAYRWAISRQFKLFSYGDLSLWR